MVVLYMARNQNLALGQHAGRRLSVKNAALALAAGLKTCKRPDGPS